MAKYSTPPRWITLDILKAISLVFMIIGHTVIWWYTRTDKYFNAPQSYFSSLVQPYIQYNTYLMMTFPMVAGTVLFFQIKSLPFQQIIKRGAFLLCLGFFINYKTWDVLQLVGFTTILICILYHWVKFEIIALLGVFIIFSAPYFYKALQPWENTYWKAIVFGGTNGDYYFPIFPWSGTIIFGFVIGKAKADYLNKKTKNNKLLIGLGSLLFLIGAFFKNLIIDVDPNNIWGPSIFSPPTSRIIANMGIYLLLIGGIETITSALKIKKLEKTSWMSIYSKALLYIYFIHYLFAENFTEILKPLQSPRVLIECFTIQLFLAYWMGRGILYLKESQKTKETLTWL